MAPNNQVAPLALESGYASNTISAKVTFLGRKRNDTFWAALFLLALLVHVGLGLNLIASQNVEFGNFDISEPNVYRGQSGDGVFYSMRVTSSSFTAKIQECNSNNSNGRLLEKTSSRDLWSIMATNPHIPIVMILMAPVMAVLWIFALYVFAFQMTWLSVVSSCAFYILIGAAMYAEGAEGSVPLMLIGVGISMLGFSLFARNLINQSAKHLKMATLVLSKVKKVFLVGAMLQCVLIGFIFLTFQFWISAAKVWQLDPNTCALTPAPTSSIATFLAIFLIWFCFFMDGLKMVITAISVGSWYFEEADGVVDPFCAAKMVFANSIGSVAIGSGITAIVEYIIRNATNKLWFLSPWGCILKCIFLGFQSCFMAFARFSLICHAFTGASYFSCSRQALSVMEKGFTGAYVNDRVGVAVIRSGAHLISISIGLLAWYWLDQVEDWTSVSDFMDMATSNLLAFLMYFLLYVWLTKNPMITICLIVMIQNIISSLAIEVIHAPMFGIFVSCISCIVLDFQGDIILNALDTIFMCFALGKENKIAKPVEGEKAQMYLLIEDFPEAKLVQT